MQWISLAIRLFIIICLVILGIFLLRPTQKILWQACQPIYLIYSNDLRYCASVIEGGYHFDFFSNTFSRSTYLFVSPEQGAEISGHVVQYQFQVGSLSNELFFPQLKDTWNDEGLAILEPTGHTLFIPSKAFFVISH